MAKNFLIVFGPIVAILLFVGLLALSGVMPEDLVERIEVAFVDDEDPDERSGTEALADAIERTAEATVANIEEASVRHARSIEEAADRQAELIEEAVERHGDPSGAGPSKGSEADVDAEAREILQSLRRSALGDRVTQTSGDRDLTTRFVGEDDFRFDWDHRWTTALRKQNVIVITGDTLLTTEECDDKTTAAVVGSQNVVKLTGRCEKIEVVGTKNVVNATDTPSLIIVGHKNFANIEKVGPIQVRGGKNFIKYTQAYEGYSPTLDAQGLGNLLQRSK